MTGYMSEMRKLVGHRKTIQCAASVICVDDSGKILLGKRTDNHKWLVIFEGGVPIWLQQEILAIFKR